MVGGARLERAGGRRVELVAHQPDRRDVSSAVADQLERRYQESQGQPAGFPRGLPPRVLLEDLDFLLRGPILAALDGRAAQWVQLDFFRARGHIGVGQLAELPHLGIRERRLRWTPSAEQVHFFHAALAERLERVVGDVGRRQLVGRSAEDADDIHRRRCRR